MKNLKLTKLAENELNNSELANSKGGINLKDPGRTAGMVANPDPNDPNNPFPWDVPTNG